MNAHQRLGPGHGSDISWRQGDRTLNSNDFTLKTNVNISSVVENIGGTMKWSTDVKTTNENSLHVA